jgi:hypothetical protein
MHRAVVIAMSVRFLKLDWRRLGLFASAGRIPRERALPHQRQIVDVALQSAVRQQVVGDIVEPEALTEFMKLLGGFHRFRSA